MSIDIRTYVDAGTPLLDSFISNGAALKDKIKTRTITTPEDYACIPLSADLESELSQAATKLNELRASTISNAENNKNYVVVLGYQDVELKRQYAGRSTISHG